MWPKFRKAGGLAGLGLLACASSAWAETIMINVDKLAFNPPQVSAHVGDTIEWHNADFVAHTATTRKKAWDVMIPAKGVGRITLMQSGDIEYYCRFHPNMVGRLSVTQ
ncbi:MAG TPA: cupredoxin domain-containing protein [Rhodopila sp.]|nr:cupredoxin domain-containing protein [Rhodopila sp.]